MLLTRRQNFKYYILSFCRVMFVSITVLVLLAPSPIYADSGGAGIPYLFNYRNPIPAEYFNVLSLSPVEHGHQMETEASLALISMLADCRAAELSPVIVSTFRTAQRQKTLFNNQVNRQKSYGYSAEQAFDIARTISAYPGTSEHEAGLAADIVAASYQTLDSKQENTKETIWLMENAHNYGFILRYPADKKSITEIIYEPWHYRYVGIEHAVFIFENALCLEEYIEYLSNSEPEKQDEEQETEEAESANEYNAPFRRYPFRKQY